MPEAFLVSAATGLLALELIAGLGLVFDAATSIDIYFTYDSMLKLQLFSI